MINWNWLWHGFEWDRFVNFEELLLLGRNMVDSELLFNPFKNTNSISESFLN